MYRRWWGGGRNRLLPTAGVCRTMQNVSSYPIPDFGAAAAAAHMQQPDRPDPWGRMKNELFFASCAFHLYSRTGTLREWNVMRKKRDSDRVREGKQIASKGQTKRTEHARESKRKRWLHRSQKTQKCNRMCCCCCCSASGIYVGVGKIRKEEETTPVDKHKQTQGFSPKTTSTFFQGFLKLGIKRCSFSCSNGMFEKGKATILR